MKTKPNIKQNCHPLSWLRGVVLVALVSTPLAVAQDMPAGASQGAPVQYVDVPAGHWAAEAIAQLTELGIITGYPDGTFGGTRPLNRYEVAVIAVRILNYVDAVVAASDGAMGMSEGSTADMQDAALDMEMIADFDTRISIVESSLEQAASQALVSQLEARISTLEAQMSAMMDADMTDMDMADVADDADMDMADTEDMADAEDMDMAADDMADMADDADMDMAAADDADDADMMDDMTVSAGNGFSGELAEIMPAGTTASEEHPLFFGIAPGLLSTEGLYISFYAGYDNLLGPVSGLARMVVNDIDEEVRITGSAIYRFDLDFVPDPIQLYAGVGAGISFRTSDSAFVLEFPVGAEYYITPRLGFFVQATSAYNLDPIDEFTADIALGLNVRF